MVCTIVICPNCGKETPEGKFCESCGASVQTTQTFQQPVAQQPVYTQQPTAAKQEINAILAALLSIFPAAGQAYLGKLGKGIGILILAIIAGVIWGPLFWIVWVYGIYDSYTTAQKMNQGKIPYSAPKIGWTIGVIVAEIIIIIVFAAIIAAFVFAMSSPRYY